MEIKVNNSKLITLSSIKDGIDGTLSVAENMKNIPFEVKRVYYIYNLNNPDAIRGKHAHKELEQVLFCISGSCSIGLDDGVNKQIITLDTPNVGVYLGTSLWHTMQDFSGNCILLVLASDFYNEGDYIRNYQQFLAWVNDNNK